MQKPLRSTTYQRIRAILCKEWNLPPFEFDKKQRAGEISLQDAISTLECIMATEPLRADGVMRYIYRERIEAIEKAQANRNKRIKELEAFLVMIARVPAKNEADKQRTEKNRRAAIAELDRLRNA